SLFPTVVSRAERIRVHVWERHQPYYYQAGHHHSGDPRIEVHQHLLKSEKVPRRLRRVHRQVWIRRFFEWSVKTYRPDEQDDSDNYYREKFDSKQIRPHVKLPGPVRLPRPGLPVMSLSEFGVLFELLDQPVICPRLPKTHPQKEGNQKQHRHDRNIVRRRSNG